MKTKLKLYAAAAVGLAGGYTTNELMDIDIQKSVRTSNPSAFEIFVDGNKCVNPACPECVIDSDIIYDPSLLEINAFTEFIYKEGFDHEG